MSKGPAPRILLLGGASGTGKTTLANALVQELGLAHHISTGFVREVAQAVMPPDEALLLRGYTFDAWRLVQASGPNGRRVFDGALAQARVLLPAMEACILRSVREGASLVVEGAHVLPGLYDHAALGVSLFCVLDVPDRATLIQRVQGQTHSRRVLAQEQLDAIIELQDECIRQARQRGVPVVENVELSNAVTSIKELLAVGAGAPL